MPFIKSKVSCPVTHQQEQELKARLGRAIKMIPGKSEDYLLLEFEDNCRLCIAGRKASQSLAYIEAAVFGSENHTGYDAFTAEITGAFQNVLGIQPGNIYIKYEDITAWGVRAGS